MKYYFLAIAIFIMPVFCFSQDAKISGKDTAIENTQNKSIQQNIKNEPPKPTLIYFAFTIDQTNALYEIIRNSDFSYKQVNQMKEIFEYQATHQPKIDTNTISEKKATKKVKQKK